MSAMVSRPTVSIVVPTTRPGLVGEAVDSVRSQLEVSDLEILVVYDGNKSDHDFELIDESIGHVVRLIATGQRSNANVARNLGVRNASSDLVALLDDDDVWLPHKLKTQMSELPALCKGHWLSVTQVQTFGHVTGLLTPSDLPPLDGPLSAFLLRRNRLRQEPRFLQTSTWLAPRHVLVERPFDESRPVHQDLDWLIRNTCCGGIQILFVREPLVLYRTSNSNSVSQSNKYIDSLDWIADRSLPATRRERGDFIMTAVVERAIRDSGTRTACLISLRNLLDHRPGIPATMSAAKRLLAGFFQEYLKPFVQNHRAINRDDS